jgi:hypothetical protein
MKENIVNKLSCTKNCEKVRILIDEFETSLGIKKTETGNCDLNNDDQKLETRTIKRRCAWCGKILGEKLAEGSGVKYGDITDGMCDNCQDEFRLDYEAYRKKKISHQIGINKNNNDLVVYI